MLIDDIRQTINAASRSNVSIYAVDPRGLTTDLSIDVAGFADAQAGGGNPNTTPDATGIGTRGVQNEVFFSQMNLRALAGPRTRIVDLGGRVVLPGLIDAHIHPAESSQDLDKCNLHDRELTAAEVKAAIARCVQAHPPAAHEWLEIAQVDASTLVLTRAELDGMRADGPLVLVSADGHSSWGNSAALAAAHIDGSTPEPRGGRIERVSRGEPTGALRDTAAEILSAAIPKPPVAVRTERLERAFALMSATGLQRLLAPRSVALIGGNWADAAHAAEALVPVPMVSLPLTGST